MPILLRDALDETFAGWEGRLPAGWKKPLAGVGLGGKDVADNLLLEPRFPIFPAFQGEKGEPRLLGSPDDSDTFKALRGVAPGKVRVVIVGQDPYPDVAKATGRSFEQGDLVDWVHDAATGR